MLVTVLELLLMPTVTIMAFPATTLPTKAIVATLVGVPTVAPEVDCTHASAITVPAGKFWMR